MPLRIDDTEDASANDSFVNLRQVLNTFAFQIKQITGQSSWRTPPPLPITELGAKGDKGDTGATGAQGIQGEKGDKGDTGAQGIQGEKGDKGDTGAQGIQGEKGDTGATGVQGIQGKKGDKGDTGATGAQGIQGVKGDTVTQVITSASVPGNPTQGLIWNELDSNGALIETWSYTSSSWRSAYKNLSTRMLGSGSGAININDTFAFDDKYNVWLDKAIVKLTSAVALTSSNYLTWYLIRSQSSTVSFFTINNLPANANYQNTVNINQIYSFDTSSNNLNLFINRIFVNTGGYNFFSSTSFSYRLIRK